MEAEAAPATTTRHGSPVVETLRDFLETVEPSLRRIKVPVDKDWEIAALTRSVIQRFEKESRPALWFENVKGFDTPVIAGLWLNRTRYAAALGEHPENLLEVWGRALVKPIPPQQVNQAPCQERVLTGGDVDLLRLPVPVWTPGIDAGPYITAGCVITRDPETGTLNAGTYRLQVKGRDRTGIWINPEQGIGIHYRKYERLDRPMPAAVVIGPDPAVCFTTVARMPGGRDEFSVAGGLRGTPVRMVRCRTVDLEVPAEAEIVLEGYIAPGEREEEGPFGEMTGFVPPASPKPVFRITAITHRERPLYHAYTSQKPPSESTNIRGLASEGILYWRLTEEMGLDGILDLHLTESSTSHEHLIVKIKRRGRHHAQHVLAAAATLSPRYGKIVTLVDDDIDIRDPFEVDWAWSFRMQPGRDVTILKNVAEMGWDPSVAPPGVEREERPMGSKMLVDATRKWDYSELALPSPEHMERVEARWSEYGIS